MSPQERTARRQEIDCVRYALAGIREELREQHLLRTLGAEPTLSGEDLRQLLTHRAAGRRLLRRLEAQRPPFVHVRLSDALAASG